jgi:hypothetical protein
MFIQQEYAAPDIIVVEEHLLRLNIMWFQVFIRLQVPPLRYLVLQGLLAQDIWQIRAKIAQLGIFVHIEICPGTIYICVVLVITVRLRRVVQYNVPQERILQAQEIHKHLIAWIVHQVHFVPLQD